MVLDGFTLYTQLQQQFALWLEFGRSLSGNISFLGLTTAQLLVLTGIAGGLPLTQVIVPRLEKWLRQHSQWLPRLRPLLWPLTLAVYLALWHAVVRALDWPDLWVDTAIILCLFWLTPRATRWAWPGRARHLLTGFVWLILALFAVDQFDQVRDALAATFIKIGKEKISILSLIQTSLIIIGLFWALRRGVDWLHHRLSHNAGGNTATLALLSKAINFLGFIFISLIGLNMLGVNLTALAFLVGALGIGLGFGLRAITSNFISGVFLLLDKSIKPGDVIAVDGTYGVVKQMHARYIVMRRRDDVEVLIPNETLMTENVINWSYSNKLLRNDLPLRVSYTADLDLVRRLLLEVAAQQPRVQTTPAPRVLITALGESGVELFLRYWITDPENGLRPVMSELYFGILKAFKANNIHIPYPREVVELVDNRPTSPPAHQK